MSNLPIDARAILEYLNDLGYRNISAEQLKEFMKGMQSQSELTTTKGNSTNYTNNKKTKTAAPADNSTQHQDEGKEVQDNKSLSIRESPNSRAIANPTTATNPRPRVIKSKRPLVNFKFYLDICDQHLTRRVEEQIKLLGATQEFLLNTYVTHFITDKVLLTTGGQHPQQQHNNNQSDYLNKNTVNSNKSYLSSPQIIAKSKNKNNNGKPTTKTIQTRADAILSRARQGQTATANNSLIAPPTVVESVTPPYIVWQAEYALRFFKKVQHELKAILHPDEFNANKLVNPSDSTKAAISSIGRTGDAIPLKGSFIKIEAIKRNCRPYYQLFRKPNEWPKIELNSDDGAFRFMLKKTTLSPPKTPITPAEMTRKSRSSQRAAPLPAAVQALRKNSNTATINSRDKAAANSSCRQAKQSSEKQCGVCEICKIEYDTLTLHLKSKAHEYFAKNPHNFIALDTLIESSADVNKFLNENEEGEDNDEGEQSVKETVEERPVSQNLEVMEIEEEKNTIYINNNSNNNNNNNNNVESPVDPLLLFERPSPVLREKSKRSTKGKHSSEKFQITNTAGPATTSTTTSTKFTSPKTPPKKDTSLAMENTTQANVDAKTTNSTTCTSTKIRKVPIAKGNLSSPIRTLMPPSSMYKVVETSEVETTPRRGRGNKVTGVDSPSLIVKFKKVRQAELCRLNGEAEKFMFPKATQRRASSDLPTDMDRPSISSEQHNASSSNISSCSSLLDSSLDIVDDQANGGTKNVHEGCDKKRTKCKTIRKSFPNAPIQPEKRQLGNTNNNTNPSSGKRLINKSLNELSPPSAAAAIVAATATIKLPAATRKSSRTATAIVTAATTSSRLLRAAAYAVKKSCSSISSLATTTSPKKSTRLAVTAANTTETTITVVSAEVEEEEKQEIVETSGRVRQSRLAATAAAVKMEDRMGESESEFNITTDNDEDDDDDDDENSQNDSKVANYKSRKKKIKYEGKIKRKAKKARDKKAKLIDKDYKCKLTKKQHWSLETKANRIKNVKRAYVRRKPYSKRGPRKLKKLDQEEPNADLSPMAKATGRRNKTSTKMYDHTKSERILELNYAFERLPTNDLWYRVFNRQDAGEERFFEFYGTTEYRKLPYELGPIPFTHAGLSSKCSNCKLCRSTRITNTITTTTSATATTTTTKQSVSTPTRELKEEEDRTLLPASVDIKRNDDKVDATTSETSMPEKLTQNSTYTHKHKKMHLLQRYRQEQEALQREEMKSKSLKLEEAANSACLANESWSNATSNNLSKDNSPERNLIKRARSVSAHSTTSSCASSQATTDTTLTTCNSAKKLYRNKHLQRVAVLNFELPPRKSPREHASTLAFVSGIINKRQESKPNSDADEACTTATSTPTPTPTNNSFTALVHEDTKPLTLVEESTQETTIKDESSKRADMNTPVEKMCFATEISENVKRMRRGRNKYDHSPPYVARNKPQRRSAVSNYAKLAAFKPQQNKGKRRYIFKKVAAPPPRAKSRSRSRETESVAQSSNKNVRNDINLPGIRKTGQKKGVLEFSVDSAALAALDAAAMQGTNSKARNLAHQIDDFLETTGKDMDIDITDLFNTTNISLGCVDKPIEVAEKEGNCTTPPATDCFSSEFDLCDLINLPKSTANIVGSEQVSDVGGKSNSLSLYNAIALNKYFRKRKYMKSNRTGWPKIQKKKYAMRHQKLKDKSKPLVVNNEDGDETKACVMTPPNSECDLTLKNVQPDKDGEIMTQITSDKRETENAEFNEHDVVKDNGLDINIVKTEDEDETQYEGSAEEADDEDEFHDAMADNAAESPTISQNNEFNNVDEEHKDIDAEEEEDQEIECCERKEETILRPELKAKNDLKIHKRSKYSDDDRGCETKRKRRKIESSLGKALANCFSSAATTATARDVEVDDDIQEEAISSAATTSTPTSHMLRGMRRTPQLNGSLLSCHSPSEKAGNNSDIFTVSSDGLDTDLDLSNPPMQSKLADEDKFQPHRSYHRKDKTSTPKTSKYMSTKFMAKPAVNSCAAEAVTAAAKTLAIAQFLNKEVRVNCRRIRAPFRRFRYRR